MPPPGNSITAARLYPDTRPDDSPPTMTPARPPRRRFLRHTSGLLLAGAGLLATTPALANQPETRSLAFSHTHTGEQLALTYAIDAHYLPDSLAAFNLLLRDHYSGEVGSIDPQLFDLLHQLQLSLGEGGAFEVISGYRCPATNATLRNTRGGGVARRSLHMDGKAIDIRLPGVPLASLRDAALALQAGGVGYYPKEQFVHLDTGRVRSW